MKIVKPEIIEQARSKLQQAKTRLQMLETRQSTLNKKIDARRKIILGNLIIEADKNDDWPKNLNDLIKRIKTERERKLFKDA